ncbi:MAG: type II secretion system protein GspC [Deferrisomatales bacterium]
MREHFHKYFPIVTLLFLAAAGFLAARLTGVLLSRQLWVAEADRTPAQVQGGEVASRESLADYRVVQERNLFNANPKPEAPPTPARPLSDTPPPPPPPAPLVPLNITLLGTAIVEGGTSFALVQSGAELKLVRVGGNVVPGAVLTAVKRDRIQVTRGGTAEDVLLYRPEGAREPQRPAAVARTEAPPAPPEEPAPGGSDTVRQVGPGKWLIDSREIEDASANMSRLMTQIRVVPNFTDGNPDGFKVFAIRPGSLFARIGLQNGDVVKRLNGVEIQGPEQAFEAYQRLKGQPSIQIDLMRRNENMSFGYEIR